MKPVLLIAALLGLTACAAPPPPRDNYHRLEVPPLALATGPVVLPGVVEVNRLDSDGLLTQRGVARQEPDGALTLYDYDLWVDDPPSMLRDALVRLLTAARLSHQVVTPDLRVPPDWMVRGRLFRFDHVVGQHRVAVRLQLSAVSARDGRLVLMETYECQDMVPDNGPAQAADALAAAAGQCLGRFVTDLARLSPQLNSVR